jgi:hypothetical protein
MVMHNTKKLIFFVCHLLQCIVQDFVFLDIIGDVFLIV